MPERRIALKSKPSLETLPGAGWGGIAARHAAGRMTRRSALCRLGYAAAAILGANFLVADGPKARATVVANPPCNLSKTCSGLYCGLSNDASTCDQLAGSCPNGCMQANGCPVGSQPEGSWTGCCSCANGAASYTVVYTDCCSSQFKNYLQLPAPCNPNPCFEHVNCPANRYSTSGWCQDVVDICGGPGTDYYICTQVRAAKNKC